MSITALFAFCLVPVFLGGLGALVGNQIKKNNPDRQTAILIGALAGLLIGLIVALSITVFIMMFVTATS
jgi:hypothetical protein